MMIDLVQYRTSIGLFPSVSSRFSKKRNTKDNNVSRGQSLIYIQLFTVILCFHFVCSNHFLDINTQFHKYSHHVNIGSRNIVKYNINETLNSFYGKISEYRRHLPIYISFEHTYILHLGIWNRSVMFQSLEMHPYSGAYCYLLGNKGMHSYNGNPPTALKRHRKETGGRRKYAKKDNISRVNVATQTCQDEDRPSSMLNTVNSWRKENIYITKSIKSVREKISYKGCVCVIGVPGAGKSTALHHAALSLETEGFIVYAISGPKDFFKYYDSNNGNKKQVFVLDDVLGVYSVDQKKVKLWLEHNADVRNALGTNTKMLVAIMTPIFMYETIRHKNIVFLDNSETTGHVDFSDADLRLKLDDMRAMLTHYLRNKGADADNIDEIIKDVWGYTTTEVAEMTESYRLQVMSEYTAGVEFADCFPLLCEVFIKTDFVKQNPKIFFTHPFPALIKVFQNIKTENKHQFCALALCIIFNGKFTDNLVSSLSESPHCDNESDLDQNNIKLRNHLMSTYELKCPENLIDLQVALNSLIGVYISNTGETYRISHAVYHDIVTYLYDDPLFVFKYGTREFIRDRVRVNKDVKQQDPYIRVYSDDTNIERLAERLFRDLKSDIWTGTKLIPWSHIWTGAKFVINNPDIDDERLISYLRSKLLDSEKTDKTLINDLFRQCMWTLYLNRDAYKNGEVAHYKLIEICVQVGVDCNMYIDLGQISLYPLHISIVTGNLKLTKLFLDNGAEHRKVNCECGNSLLDFIFKYAECNKMELGKICTLQDKSVDDGLFVSLSASGLHDNPSFTFGIPSSTLTSFGVVHPPSGRRRRRRRRHRRSVVHKDA